MRRIIVSALALVALTAPSFAARLDVSCRQYARAVADDYMAERLERAPKIGAMGNANQVLIVGAGKAHYMPRYQSGITRSYLQERNLWTSVYNEEYWRCFHGGDIDIHVNPSDLTE